MHSVHLLFLDIDGVLHTPSLGEFIEFEHEPLLAAWLARHASVRVVLTSTHREELTLEGLKARFSPGVAQRIIGATPVTPLGRAYGGRQREIQAWLKASSLPQAPWVALDDEDLLFDQPCARLIKTHPWTGLLPEHLEAAEALLFQDDSLFVAPPSRDESAPAAADGRKVLRSPAEKARAAREIAREAGVRPERARPPAPVPRGWWGRLMHAMGMD